MVREFQITGLNCAGCVGRAEAALAAIPGAGGAQVNLASHSGQVAGVTAAAVEEALARAGYPARRVTAELSVPEMHCGSCVARVEDAARGAGALSAEANLAERALRVEMLAGDAAGLADLRAALAQAGFAAEVVSDTPEVPDEAPAALHRFEMAAALSLPVLVLEMGGHIFPAFHHWIMRTIGMETSHLIQMILTLIVLAWPGAGFFARGVPGILRARPDMDALVALGTSAAFGFSAVSALAPGLLPPGSAAVYFETAAIIVTLILLGRWLEARARARTGDAVRALMDLAPDTAVLLQGGAPKDVPARDVAVGDRLLLRPGARVPVDGVVAAGISTVDEALLTGEPVPVSKAEGDSVSAGCINGAGTLEITATGVGAETSLARIVAMTRRAQAARLPVQEVINQVTAWFVPAVLAIAALTFGIWLALDGLGPAVVAAISVLIIACPCAMGLATPVSVMVGTGRAAEHGVLFRTGAALQRLGQVAWVAFDKTGTVTQGAPHLTDRAFADGVDGTALMARIGALEAQSEHPLARALAREAGDLDVAEFRATPGQGAAARVAGRALRVGNAGFMEGADFGALADRAASWAAEGATPIFVTEEGRAVAALALRDPLRADAPAAMAGLRGQGLSLALMSGDVPAAADHIGAALGMDAVHGGLRPEDKVAALRGLPGPAAFVGDGINDAPVLAAAEVGIAIAGGADVASEAAGVVLTAPGPAPVVRAVALSRATMRNIRQNLVWAFGYNVLLIPVAAGALVPFGGPTLSPALAGGAMALSSVAVVTNALRLRRA
ncbi:MAG: heavy metal translocating P-type ATPase [Pseudomonadota bacterium]